MISVITIIISVAALLTSIWSVLYSSKKNKSLILEIEKREALKLLVELIGGLANHFITVHMAANRIKDPASLKEMFKPLINAFNEKDIITQLTNSTLILPEHEDRMILSQQDFVHLNTTLLPLMATNLPLDHNQIERVATSAERTMSFYHELREIVRSDHA